MTPADTGSPDERFATGPLQRWAFRMRPGEDDPAALLRSWLRIIFIMLREFSAAAISLRAAALTYSIVLSLVPLLAMSTAILKGLGGGDQLKVAAYRLLEQLEPAPAPPTGSGTPAGVQGSGPGAEGAQHPQATPALTRDLSRALDTIFNYVERTNFAAIGAFGIVGLLLTVILVMSTIEDAMNAIWHTDQGRSFLRKVMDYLALLLLLPVSINVAIAGEAILASPRMMAQIQAIIPSAWMLNTLLKLLPFVFVILSLTVMYMFFPSVRVSTAAALTGAVFAGVFWFIGQKLYLILQIGVARSNAIYGSFATVPLFLIWVQMGWTFILLGAVLAYAVQNRNQYRLPGTPLLPQQQLQLAFDVLQAVYANFARKKRTTSALLVSALKKEQPADILAVVGALVGGGFLLKTEGGRPTYLPTAPAEALNPGDIIRLILGSETAPTPGGLLAEKAVQAAAGAFPQQGFSLCPVNPMPTGATDSPAKEEDLEKTS